MRAIAGMVIVAGGFVIGTNSALGDEWTGVYAGIGGGLAMLDTEIGIESGPLLPPNLFTLELDGIGSSGGFATLVVGADMRLGDHIVVGVLGDYSFDSAATTLDYAIPSIPLTINAQAKLSSHWDLGVRAGVLANPSTLIYVDGGYAQLELSDLEAMVNIGGQSQALTAGVATLPGFFVGGGMETMLWSNISLRFDYRYAKFGADDLDLPTIASLGIDLNDLATADVEPTMQTGMVTLSYRLGTGGGS